MKACIQDAANQLRESGFQKSTNLLQRLQDFADDPAVAAGSHYGRVIFCSPTDFEQFYLTTTAAASLHIGGSFYIRHLAAELSRPHSFYVLSLSKTGVRLLHCAGLHAEPTRLPSGVPETLDEELGLDRPDHGLENRSAAGVSTGAMRMVRFGTGSEHDHQKRHLADYFKLVDRGIQQIVRESDMPLVLAGVHEDVAVYRAVSTSGCLAKTSIMGSTDVSRDPSEILEKAHSILIRERTEHQHAALLATRERAGQSRLSTDLSVILKAAFEGRVAQLYVNEAAMRIGTFERGIYQSWGKEDLLNLAAAQTFIHRGRFCELPAEMMPEGAATAILRY